MKSVFDKKYPVLQVLHKTGDEALGGDVLIWQFNALGKHERLSRVTVYPASHCEQVTFKLAFAAATLVVQFVMLGRQARPSRVTVFPGLH